eukprot:6727127-Lingulodinium_polyedra.AAC.1
MSFASGALFRNASHRCVSGFATLRRPACCNVVRNVVCKIKCRNVARGVVRCSLWTVGCDIVHSIVVTVCA